MPNVNGTPGPEDVHERVRNLLSKDVPANFQKPFNDLTIAEKNAVVRSAFSEWLSAENPEARRIEDVIRKLSEVEHQQEDSA